ncbi:MAG TPA: PAS domain S-box protein [Terriglobia bacterium]|nr:PAS domain S-box protein [Terriglobia bacterium]
MTSENPTIFERLFESSPDGIVVTNQQGLIIRVNAQTEKMFGYTRGELLGQPVEILVPQRFHATHPAHRQQYHTQPRSRPMGAGLELYGSHKDGSEFPVDIMLSPIETQEGTLVLGVVRDITERKRAERALRESRALLEKLFEASPDGILLVTSLEGRIVRVNAQVEKMSGYSRDELVGQSLEVLVAPRSRNAHVLGRSTYRPESRAGGPGAILELYARRKDGEEFPVEITASPVETYDGEMVLGVVRDVTQRKQAEDALRHSEERLRSILESVQDYAIFTLDPQGRVSSWTPAAERIKGYRADEILGQHFSRFYLPEDIERGKPEHELKMAAQLGRFEDEGWRLRKDGARFWANVVITALRDSSGVLRGFSKVTRDFTERKQGEEALLLQVTNTLIASVDIRRLFAAISAGIHQVIAHDYANLALYDHAAGKLRLHVLDGPSGKEETVQGTPIPLEGWPAGEAFTTREPLLINRSQEMERFSPEFIKRWAQLGLKSGCWLPLLNRGRSLGTLVVASRRESAFSASDVHVLSHVANQVALAVDNAEAFRQVAELRAKLAEEKAYLEEELRTEYNFEEIIGESSALKRTLKQVETVAPTDATVLILGETGTGKELIARAIHHLSGRRERTFVKLNCAAIPSGLLESELFGHEKGAFTGAISQKIGRLELAHQGTLFLDEVGDIPLELQPKLLRALQEKEFERLGSTRTIPVDVRLIAATNRDLTQMVKDRQFRSDLYYRLRVFPVQVSALRERAGDIPVLVHHFVQKHARRMNKRIETIPPEAMQAFKRWHWPGNVRELENLIERAVILSPGQTLRVPLSELIGTQGPETPFPELSTLEAAEREHILRALRETQGVIAGPKGAAARLGLKRTTLNAKMRKLGINRRDF